jgi:hypothetical protein
MGVIVLVSSVLFYDIGSESLDTLVLASVKNSVQAEIANNVIENPECFSTLLRLNSISYSAQTKTIGLSVGAACPPSASKIANEIEKTLCNAIPNGDTVIDCGTNKYTLSIT